MIVPLCLTAAVMYVMLAFACLWLRPHDGDDDE